jgi:hypothetical protein
MSWLYLSVETSMEVQNAVSSAFFEIRRLKRQKRDEAKSPIAGTEIG